MNSFSSEETRETGAKIKIQSVKKKTMVDKLVDLAAMVKKRAYFTTSNVLLMRNVVLRHKLFIGLGNLHNVCFIYCVMVSFKVSICIY